MDEKGYDGRYINRNLENEQLPPSKGLSRCTRGDNARTSVKPLRF